MALLILGLALWTLAHLFKRIAPAARARLGNLTGKTVVAALSLAAIVLMVVGYRRAGFEPLWTPFPWAVHVNNLLMLGAVFLMGVPHSRGIVKHHLRHPMLTGVVIWAVAHLLVNGDLASLILFGGLLVWAVASMLLINRQEVWTAPPAGTLRGDAVLLGISVVVYAGIAAIHTAIGPNPFLSPAG